MTTKSKTTASAHTPNHHGKDMTTPKAPSHSTARQTSNPKGDDMTTKKIAPHHASANETTAETAATAPQQPATATPAAAATPMVFVNPPPPLTAIPDVPPGTQNANGQDQVAALPKHLELAVMPDVITELGRFTDYAAVFGKTAPPLEYVLQTATAAGQWSAMRVKSAAWDAFARTQEGASWTDFRDIMDMLRPALALAVKMDATIARQFPALVRLFGTKSVIAQRGVTTRAANKAAKAEGKAPVRGKLAKKARRLKSAAATLAAAGQTVTVVAPTPSVRGGGRRRGPGAGRGGPSTGGGGGGSAAGEWGGDALVMEG